MKIQGPWEKGSPTASSPKANTLGTGPMAFLRHPAFSELDRHFALLIARLSAPAPEVLTLAAALVSRSRGEGHTCLDLRRLAGTALSGDWDQHGMPLALPEFDSWIHQLKSCPVVGSPPEFKPLILDGTGRLYLHRYWQYESTLAAAISRRAADAAEPIKPEWLRETLNRYFPTSEGIDWQRLAAFTALTKRLCVIAGGPGTGKTRTVAVLLAILIEQAGSQPLRIALTAPTGKAAARLQESIKQARATLPSPDSIKARLPEEAATIHRLLGTRRDSASFKHHAANPLPYDVVVIDEASMVDLALMAKLFDAVPPQSRIILLGDKNQLASVEAGSVLSDICPSDRANGFSPDLAAQFRLVTGQELPSAKSIPLSDCIVQLQRNYRFGSDNGILALSAAVNRGDANAALRLFRERSEDPSGIAAATIPDRARLKEKLRAKVRAGFGEMLKAPDARTALAALERFRVLCALRQGPFGVENVNRLVEEILREAGLLPLRERWYHGRPVMILTNDYDLRLFNGDVGIVRVDPESGEPRAHFLDANQELRSLAPARLPEHETVFAMTVHKSQGSEFGEVLLLLPDRENPVLTRELLYTGITRASRRVELWFDEAVLRAAMARRVERASGLQERLWGESGPSSP